MTSTGKFRVGDRVRCVRASEYGPMHAGEAGKIYTVAKAYLNTIITEELPGDPGSACDRFELVRSADARYADEGRTLGDILEAALKDKKPAFKVGDRVFITYGHGWDGPAIVTEMEETYFCAACANGSEGGFAYEFASLTPPTSPCIVAWIDNGQPKPAARPHVHADRATAEAEADRLSRTKPGREFGVYELVATRHQPREYEHEWQRLAVGGKTYDAKSRLSSIAGIEFYQAANIVNDFLRAA